MTVLRPPYLHNGISHTGKAILLHWSNAHISMRRRSSSAEIFRLQHHKDLHDTYDPFIYAHIYLGCIVVVVVVVVVLEVVVVVVVVYLSATNGIFTQYTHITNIHQMYCCQSLYFLVGRLELWKYLTVRNKQVALLSCYQRDPLLLLSPPLPPSTCNDNHANNTKTIIRKPNGMNTNWPCDVWPFVGLNHFITNTVYINVMTKIPVCNLSLLQQNIPNAPRPQPKLH